MGIGEERQRFRRVLPKLPNKTLVSLAQRFAFGLLRGDRQRFRWTVDSKAILLELSERDVRRLLLPSPT